ncbi:MAG: DNA polymerase III subunit alpha, partial [Gemmatimonadota bacterium]
MTFVELRAHSAFSFGDGAMSPESLVHRAAELGYSAVGLTDAADLGGIPRFITEAGRKNLKPIVGAELEVDGCPLALLVRSREGYRNLAALVTRARVADLDTWHPDRPHVPRGRPGVTWTDVAERSGGLHLLTGPGSSRLAALMRVNNLYDAEQHLARCRDAFGEHVTIEVQRHQAGRHEAALADALIELAGRERMPWVVTQNPRYLDDRGRLVHDMLTALRANLTLDEAAHAGALLPNGRWRLLAPEEMARLWARQPAGIEESEHLAAGCNFDVEWMRPALPDFSPPADEHGRAYTGSLDDFLREQVYAGAHVRWGHALSSEQCRQIDHELGVISRLRFAGFFLVIWDAVRHARSLGILCQGRGSAANSAVAYCLDVTAVDPIANGLLFERFLSEGRLDGNTEAPDIDVDIEHDRREEVLDYVYAKWHRSQAAITCTVQHYRAPNALLDAMRALGFPVDLAHALSKRMHHAEPADGAELLRQGLAAQFGLALDDPRGRTLLALMRGCEGLPRIRSTHVGGFVLSAEPLGNCLPIEPTAMGRTIVQFDKDDLDQLGIPKFDFLGLGALAMVRRAFDAIERRTGTRHELYSLPYEDAPTYELVARGDTVGTFQIESRAQIASLVHTRPELLYDIVVQVALIRPGPIQAGFVHPYTRRRRGQEEPDYIDESLRPILEPILKRTYGIPIFQEQAMAIAMQLGHYSAAEADGLRRTMGHQRKRKRLMAELAKLEAAITAQGIAPPIAAKVVQYLESFG